MRGNRIECDGVMVLQSINFEASQLSPYTLSVVMNNSSCTDTHVLQLTVHNSPDCNGVTTAFEISIGEVEHMRQMQYQRP